MLWYRVWRTCPILVYIRRRRQAPPGVPSRPPSVGRSARKAHAHGSRREHPHRAGQRRLRAPRRAGGAGPGAPRSPADLRREGPVQPPPRPRDRRHRAGPQLRRPRPRPRRHAGRHRPDGAAAVHDRRACPQVAVPTTVHCDHLIQAKSRRRHRPRRPPSTPTPRSTTSSSRSRPSTASASGSRAAGIIHQVVLEQYAFPGGMMIGTDSHTPNAGGLGMVAIGVGGADAVDVMAGFPFNVRWPKLIGVHLTGELSGWTAPEGRHPQGRRHPHREGRHRRHRRVLRPRRRRRISCTGKATICNMGAEIGATTLAVPLRRRHGRYLKATGRDEIADAADARRRRPAGRRRGPRRPRALLRPGHRDRPRRRSSRTSSARTPPTSPARSASSAPRPQAEG